VKIQQRLLAFVIRTNWVLFLSLSLLAVWLSSPAFFRGVVCGGLLVLVNFHLLARTLRRALTPPHLASTGSVLAKYYIRFIISGVIIFFLISTHFVNPLGLLVGLSVVVGSIMLATLCELTKLIIKEAA
jgi:hypothetical protein